MVYSAQIERQAYTEIWIRYILASAFFLALYDLAKKASVRGNAVLPTLLFSSVFGFAAFAAGVAAGGNIAAALGASWRTVGLAAVKSLIVSTSWIFTFCALRTLPISIATPIRASAPAVVFVVAFFAYGEVPTPVQGVGMALVFAGYFAFSWAGRHEGIDFLRNHAVWCAFGGMLCSAGSSLWDKYVFQVAGAPVPEVQFWFQVFLVVVYASLAGARWAVRARIRRRGGSAPGDTFEWRWTIPLVGILLAFVDWLYFTGLAFPGVPISVGSLMRRVSVVFTFVLGIRVFHEGNVLRKSLALCVILAGIVLLCL